DPFPYCCPARATKEWTALTAGWPARRLRRRLGSCQGGDVMTATFGRISVLVVLLLAVPAAAGAGEAAGSNEGPPLEEVVITARFRTESLQTAPIAVTALTGEQLQAHGYQNVTQVAD